MESQLYRLYLHHSAGILKIRPSTLGIYPRDNMVHWANALKDIPFLGGTETELRLFPTSPSLCPDVTFPAYSIGIFESLKQETWENWISTRPSGELFHTWIQTITYQWAS
jgi:hypothetical protein